MRRDAVRDAARPPGGDAEAGEHVVAGVRRGCDDSCRHRHAPREKQAEVPPLAPAEASGLGVDGEVVHRDRGRHGKPPGQHVLRPVIEVDARRRHQPGQPPVIPADLMVRRGQRNLDRLDAEVAERAGLVGEHDVIVPTRPDERGDELAGVRRRATHDADQRSDPDAHPHLVARGAPTGVARRPVAARSPATAPCPSARTISRSPRSAWSAALAATIAP